MKPTTRLMVIGGVVALVAGSVWFATRHSTLATQDSLKATYYCPMHPTYTSDRPGDCPICNMKLVKRETEPASPAPGMSRGRPTDPQAAIAKKFESICILHNCSKLHDGRPCPMTVVARPGEKVTCPICGTHIAEADEPPRTKKLLYWTDPMIPGYKADGPGKSPMGMDLVPVYEEAHASATSGTPQGYAPVLLTPQKQQLIGVKTSPVERRRLTKTIRAAGTIAHDPELYQAQVEYIQSIQTLQRAQEQTAPEDIVAQAQRMVDSTRIRLKHLGLSDDLITEIAGWTEPEHSLLFAHPGDPVWMYAQVYEYELPLVRVGQEVQVEVPTLSGETFRGAIRAIDQMVDPMTRTTRIRAQLQDPAGHLRPDMYVNAAIAVDVGEVLAVPNGAVFSTGEKQIVFVDKGQGLFEPRDVTVGAQADGFDEVKQGVAEGEPVVTSGNFLIDSESRLKGALEGAGGGSGHQHGQ
ncbi:MAG: efflux RND transporter periplasmic adaptor subunit [Candidatus Omnitrophica bacterium]|nr:efflux RND transporter periplasmic adaptor subunit [Candidatus Omnitrophota bacterium]